MVQEEGVYQGVVPGPGSPPGVLPVLPGTPLYTSTRTALRYGGVLYTVCSKTALGSKGAGKPG